MNGFVIVNKEQNITSFGVCSRLRKLTNTKKVGHTGTLDPMACGVLVVAVGNAAKLINYIPNHDKRYTAGIRFGYVSDTLDIWGDVKKSGIPSFSKEELKDAISFFEGSVTQTTPQYSAAKYKGRHLYEYARKGIEVVLPERNVNISDIRLVSFDDGAYTAVIDVSCSKGTYIRSVCSDLGNMLGCGAVMESLTRTRAGDFDIEKAFTLSQIEELLGEGNTDFLLPCDIAVSHLKRFNITKEAEKLLYAGNLIYYPLTEEKNPQTFGETVALYFNGSFAALGITQEDGVKPNKVFIEYADN